MLKFLAFSTPMMGAWGALRSDDADLMQHLLIHESLDIAGSQHAATALEKVDQTLSMLHSSLVTGDVAAELQARFSKGQEPVTLEDVITQLKEIVVPVLDESHLADQQLMERAEQALADCKSTRQALDNEVQLLRNDFDQAKTAHRTCRRNQTNTDSSQTSVCGARDAYYTSINPPACEKPLQDGLDAFLSTGALWYSETLQTWTEKQGLCTNATEQNNAQSSTCNSAQVQMEADYCSWYHEQYVQWSSYELCWEAANDPNTGYEATKSAVAGRETARTHNFGLFKEITCLIEGVLTANTSSTSKIDLSAATAACKNQVVNLTSYNITYAAPTSFDDHEFELTVPQEPSWADEHFADFTADHYEPNHERVACHKGAHAQAVATQCEEQLFEGGYYFCNGYVNGQIFTGITSVQECENRCNGCFAFTYYEGPSTTYYQKCYIFDEDTCGGLAGFIDHNSYEGRTFKCPQENVQATSTVAPTTTSGSGS
jgi:hypothetical protein